MSKCISISHYAYFFWGSPAAMVVSISIRLAGIWQRARGEEEEGRRCVFHSSLSVLLLQDLMSRKASRTSPQAAMFHNHIMQRTFT